VTYCPHGCKNGWVSLEENIVCPIHEPSGDFEATTRRPHELKAVPYDAYLRSPEWQRKRRHALERADHRCEACGNREQLDVHHMTYENRGQELPSDLVVFCRSCHDQWHAGKKYVRGRWVTKEGAES
jgi:5-methylcytosine-specific restriction endonuclease McrA